MEINKESEADFVNYLTAYFDERLSNEIISNSMLSEELKNEFKEIGYASPRPGAIGFLVPKINYVIRNEDLGIIDSLIHGLGTAAGVNFFVAPASTDHNKIVAAVIGVFGTILKLGRNIRNKGKILPAIDFSILLCLKNNPGINAHYLCFLLGESGVVINPSELEKRLTALGAVYMNDGSKKELVIKEDGKYRTAGI